MEQCLLGIQVKIEEIGVCDRAYIGEESCDTFLLNHRESVMRDAEQLTKSEKKFTLVLPIVNETNFDSVISFVLLLKERNPCFCEVICNDIGMMDVLNDDGFLIGAGRIFCRSHMPLLCAPEADARKHFPFLKRIEIDCASKKYLDKLPYENISLYLNDVMYGFSNDRCAYFMKYGGDTSRIECKSYCVDKQYKLKNKYKDGEFEFYHNTIRKTVECDAIPDRINRVIRIKK